MRAQHITTPLAGLLMSSLLGAGCGGGAGPADDGGLIVCSSIDEDGRATGDLSVIDEAGSLLRTISLGQPVVPTARGAGSWVLYRSLEDELWFVDVASGRFVPAGTRSPNLTLPPDEHRFAVAESFPDSQGDKTVTMFDFATGALTDLTAVLDPAEPTVVVWIDADAAGTNLLVWDTSGPAWVVPTADPHDAWNLGDRSVPGDLSDDGARVVFRDATGDVYLGDIARRSTTLLATDPGLAVPQFTEGGRVLMQTTTGLVLIDPDGSVRVLWETEDEAFPLSRPLIGPGGTTAVAGFGTGEPTWLHVSLPAGAVSSLALGEMRVLTATDHYLVLSEAREAALPMVDTLAVVDLAAGSVRRVILPADGVFPQTIVSNSGDALVLTGASGVHLVDLETGSLTSLGKEVRAARFSPDGARIVLDVWDGSDGGSGDIAIASFDDPGAAQPLAAHCVQPVWVPSG